LIWDVWSTHIEEVWSGKGMPPAPVNLLEIYAAWVVSCERLIVRIHVSNPDELESFGQFAYAVWKKRKEKFGWQNAETHAIVECDTRNGETVSSRIELEINAMEIDPKDVRELRTFHVLWDFGYRSRGHRWNHKNAKPPHAMQQPLSDPGLQRWHDTNCRTVLPSTAEGEMKQRSAFLGDVVKPVWPYISLEHMNSRRVVRPHRENSVRQPTTGMTPSAFRSDRFTGQF
jgi:hypothetical protein